MHLNNRNKVNQHDVRVGGALHAPRAPMNKNTNYQRNGARHDVRSGAEIGAEAISEAQSPERLIKIALVSCGLGNVQRGFEISTSRWFGAISDQEDLEVKLFSGGNFPGATKIPNIARDVLLNSPLRLFRRFGDQQFWEFCYIVEQLTFMFCLGPWLVWWWRPDIVWTKEVPLLHFLYIWRFLFNLKFKIIFANGGAFSPPTYKDADYIQHLHPESYDDAVKKGIPIKKMEILPNCVEYRQPEASKEKLRKNFGFKTEDWIVICVAAWNRYQKRIDYLINEVANMNDPAVKLLLCGHPENETGALKQLAEEKLGNKVRWMTLSPSEVSEALSMADVFVLPSFREGLSNSLIEAVMAGLPVVSHPHPGGKYILEDNQCLIDLSKEDNLKNHLIALKTNPPSSEVLTTLQERAVNRFSSKALGPKFCSMLKKIVTNSRFLLRDPAILDAKR
jgi:glycosyltransferase involved in cell wall biosynthesis